MQSGWVLCISPGRGLWVHDPGDTASRLGVCVEEVHNPAAANLPLTPRWVSGVAAEAEGAMSRLALPTQLVKTPFP